MGGLVTTAKIVKEAPEGFYLFVPCKNHKYEVRRAESILVEFEDGRKLTGAQRRKAFVLLRYISMWWSYTPLECTKEIMKLMFRESVYSIKDESFSLSDCDRTTARLYITYLIDFCLLHDVDIGEESLLDLCEDVGRYVWACLMNKKCAVCSASHADLHHVQAIGAGRNRRHVYQIGMPVMSLCRKHHEESHRMGQQSFMKKYHLQPVDMNEEICKVYGLTRDNLGYRKGN